MKYILLGAISSAVMLFGIALIYGAIGETGFRRSELLLDAVFGPTVALGLAMFVAGLGFKLSMAPFHLWAPGRVRGRPHPGDGAGLRALQGRGVRAHTALPCGSGKSDP